MNSFLKHFTKVGLKHIKNIFQLKSIDL